MNTKQISPADTARKTHPRMPVPIRTVGKLLTAAAVTKSAPVTATGLPRTLN